MTKPEVKEPNNAANATATDSASGNSIVEFLKSTKAEFDKVVWPSRQQLIGESASVLLMVVAAATLVSLVDSLFRWIAARVF